MPESIICGQLLHTETLFVNDTNNNVIDKGGLGHFGHVREVEPEPEPDRQRVNERGQVPGQELSCRELGMGRSDQNC